MNSLKKSNEYRKVTIENIVFLQGGDYLQYERDRDVPNYLGDIEYLLQWYYPDEYHEQDDHYAMDLNTPFLGHFIKIDGYKGYFLFSKNTHLGYIGLARLVSLWRKE